MRRGLAVVVLIVGVCTFIPAGSVVYAAAQRRVASESPKDSTPRRTVADPKPSDDPSPTDTPTPSESPSPSPTPTPSPSPSATPPPSPTPTRSSPPPRSSSPPPTSAPSPISRGSHGPPFLPTDNSIGFVFSPVASTSASVRPPRTVETTSAAGVSTSPVAVSVAAEPVATPTGDPAGSGGSMGWVRVPFVIGVVLLSAVLLAFGIKYDSTGRWPWR